MQQVREAGNPGDGPLVVLASRDRAARSAQSPAEAAWYRHQVEQVQPRLAMLSSRGRLVLLDGDVTASDIVRAIYDVVDALP